MNIIIKNLLVSGMIFLLISHGIIEFGMFKYFQFNSRLRISGLIESGIADHDQVLFIFDKENYRDPGWELKWINANEFRYQGGMFDIINTVIKGDSIYLYCVQDMDESDLYAILDKIIEEDDDDQDDQGRINNFISQDYFSTYYSNHLQPPPADSYLFGACTDNLLDGEYLMPTPPPRA
jgi:hypothetical protein